MRDPCCCFERAQHLRGPWCVRSDRHPISAATGYLVDVRGHRRPCWCWAGTSCDVRKLEHGRAFAGWKLGLGAFNVSCLFILKRECMYCQGGNGGGQEGEDANGDEYQNTQHRNTFLCSFPTRCRGLRHRRAFIRRVQQQNRRRQDVPKKYGELLTHFQITQG